MKIEDLSFTCNVCDKDLKCSFYHYGILNSSIDTCVGCFEGFSSVLKPIDRTNISVEEKPLVWPCFICRKGLGGGCKWYTDNRHLDICTPCYEKGLIADFKEKFLFVDVEKIETYAILDRVMYGVVSISKPVVLHDPRDLLAGVNMNVINIKLVEDECGSNGHECDCDSEIHNTAFANIKSSIYDWVIFTKTVESDVYYVDFEACFAINANPDSVDYCNIAVIIYDNHGRMGIWNEFSSVDNFKATHKEFLIRPVLSNEDRSELQKVIKASFTNTYTADTGDLIRYTKEFSAYYIIKHDIPYYYG